MDQNLFRLIAGFYSNKNCDNCIISKGEYICSCGHTVCLSCKVNSYHSATIKCKNCKREICFLERMYAGQCLQCDSSSRKK